MAWRLYVPYRDHVVVHPLELILRSMQGVRGRIELIGLEALVGKPDLEGFITFLTQPRNVSKQLKLHPGHCSYFGDMLFLSVS